MKTKYNPLSDIKQAIEYHYDHGIREIKIRIVKSKFDELLEFSGCKNEDELRKEYYNKFGKELCKIELLEG